MLKKTITYTDFNGNQVTEDFYFNLTKAEIAEMELSHKVLGSEGESGGFTMHLQRVIDTGDGNAIMNTFKEFILASIGRKSEDGKRFVKNQEIRDEFVESNAYSEFFMELVTRADAAAEFVNGLMPADILNEVQKASGAEVVNAPVLQSVQEPKDDRPAYVREDREPTEKELREMSADELREAFKWKLERRNQ